ncbi:9494_t:CDS:1, partial [Gigaspora rosea]
MPQFKENINVQFDLNTQKNFEHYQNSWMKCPKMMEFRDRRGIIGDEIDKDKALERLQKYMEL